MQTRKDQVQAYSFLLGRLVTALMRGRPDEPAAPVRRFSSGALGGILLAALVVAGFGVFGLIRPGGNDTWRVEGAIVVERESGARFVYLGDELHPVLNFTSARLVAGASATVHQVSRSSLDGVARGATLGIPDAPDALPAAAELSSDPWLVCAGTTTAADGTVRAVTDLLVADSSGTATDPAAGLLVTTEDGSDSLVWQGRRYELPTSAQVVALGYADATPWPVTAAWLGTVPAGPSLRAQAVPGTGAPSTALPGVPARVGQVVEVRNTVIGSDDLYLLRQDGLLPLSATEATLQLSDPATAAAYPGATPAPVTVGPDVLAAAPRVGAARTEDAGLPTTPPVLAQPAPGGATLPCVRFAVGPDDGPVAELVTVAPAALADADAVTGASTRGGGADRVHVPPGRGVLVRDLPAPGVAAGTLHLVTDLGVQDPLADADVATTLGLDPDRAVPVPNRLLALLPVGPALDPAAALVPRSALTSPGPG